LFQKLQRTGSFCEGISAENGVLERVLKKQFTGAIVWNFLVTNSMVFWENNHQNLKKTT
jgi:hypothetical protein